MKPNKFLLIWGALVLLAVGAIFSSPFWAWGTSTYTHKFNLELPEQGDVGWDDAIRLNHKIFEIVAQPILDGHCVVSGLTMTYSTGTTVSWDAGYVKYSNAATEWYVPAGVTTLANNTINFLSAVTAGVQSGATIQARSTEYDIPSGASGFAHVPVGMLVLEAGNVVRMKDVRHMPATMHRMNQNVDSGATPTFSGIKTTLQGDFGSVNSRGGLTLYGSANPTPTVQGQMQYDTNNQFIAIGDGTNTRAVMTGTSIYVMISSPDLLDNPNNQPFWKNTSGTSFVITGAQFRISDQSSPLAGVTLDVYSGASIEGYKASAGGNVFRSVKLDTTGGVSIYRTQYTTGTTVVPPDRPLILDFGDGSTGDWLEIIIGGYYEGNRP